MSASTVINTPSDPKTPSDLPRVDGQRLWDSLMELAQIGATPKGGVCRLTLTDLDKQGRDLVSRWAGGRHDHHGRQDRQHLPAPARAATTACRR
jgi:hypothetical protein